MNQENKTCQNCKIQFTIDLEDFQFYQKINVPPPTWCPECRMMRKLLWGFGFNLFKRKCDAPGHTEEIISRYPEESDLKIYDYQFWLSDKWDPQEYKMAYDFSRPFFAQLKELFRNVPRRNLLIVNSVKCDYCPSALDCKNCYLVGGGYMSENCFYSNTPILSKDVVDSFFTLMGDTLYTCFNCTRSFHISFGTHVHDSMDSQFLFDCRNCSECFGSVNLRNKSHYLFNEPHGKKEYREKVAAIDTGSYKVQQEVLARHEAMVARYPKRFATMKNAVDCTGDVIENAKNCKHAFRIAAGAENCKYVLIAGRGIKDSYDVFGVGATVELLYETTATVSSQRVFFSDNILNSTDVMYSRDCLDSSNLFGCSGLKNKQYCILNAQYSKEEYEAMVPKIIVHMSNQPYKDSGGLSYGFGEFFPSDLAPNAYNTSAAVEYFPLSEEKALTRGYKWWDGERGQYAPTISSADLSDHIRGVKDSILEEVIGCANEGKTTHCAGAFRVIPDELKFYRAQNIPLPRLCPNCREYEIFKRHPAYRLVRRTCMCGGVTSENGVYSNATAHVHGKDHCGEIFETAYSPERKEIVYCEGCYNSELV